MNFTSAKGLTNYIEAASLLTYCGPHSQSELLASKRSHVSACSGNQGHGLEPMSLALSCGPRGGR
jgi:hypothetical protein